MKFYDLIWMPKAENRLAEVWMAAPDRNAVTHAANGIDADLEVFPNSVGKLVFDTVLEHSNAVLTVEFEVVEEDRCVFVLDVWSTKTGNRTRPRIDPAIRGQLLPLPGDLLKERNAAKAEVEELRKEIARLKAARNGAH